MTKTMNRTIVIAGLLLTAVSAAQAQTLTPQPETGAYISIGAGVQPQKRSFGSSGTFTSFNETGRFEVNQNVGSGFLFDVGGGYQFLKHLAAGVSFWNVRNKSAVAAAASIPDPVFFGRFTTVNVETDEDLTQSTLGINLSIIYTMPVADRFDFCGVAGPHHHSDEARSRHSDGDAEQPDRDAVDGKSVEDDGQGREPRVRLHVPRERAVQRRPVRAVCRRRSRPSRARPR